MPSIVRSADLTLEELRYLGENVVHAVDLERQEVSAVNRGLACHGESAEGFIESPPHPSSRSVQHVPTSPTPRPAA